MIKKDSNVDGADNDQSSAFEFQDMLNGILLVIMMCFIATAWILRIEALETSNRNLGSRNSN